MKSMKKKVLMMILVCLAFGCMAGCGKKQSNLELAEYKGIKYQKQEITVTEEDLQAMVDSLAEACATYETDESRADTAVKKGDFVNIDYSGVLEGETTPFAGGTAQGAHLEIGSGNYVPGFEDGLIGKKPGETTVLKLTFPTQYYASVAGKKVAFTVTINAIEKKIVPEVTDSLVNEYTEGNLKTVAEYKEYARQYLLSQREASYKTAVKSTLLKDIVSKTTFKSIDQKRIDSCYEDLLKYYDTIAQQSGLSLEEYIAANYTKTAEEFYAELKATAEETVKEEIVLDEIISREKLGLTDEAYNSMIGTYMSKYGYEDQKKFENDYNITKIKQNMLYDMALKIIFDAAVAE